MAQDGFVLPWVFVFCPVSLFYCIIPCVKGHPFHVLYHFLCLSFLTLLYQFARLVFDFELSRFYFLSIPSSVACNYPISFSGLQCFLPCFLVLALSLFLFVVFDMVRLYTSPLVWSRPFRVTSSLFFSHTTQHKISPPCLSVRPSYCFFACLLIF